MISLSSIITLFLSTTCFGCSYEPSSGWLFFLSKAKYKISNAIVIVTYKISYNIYKKIEVKFIHLYNSINTFTAIVDLSRYNNSCLKSPASTLVDLIFNRARSALSA